MLNLLQIETNNKYGRCKIFFSPKCSEWTKIDVEWYNSKSGGLIRKNKFHN